MPAGLIFQVASREGELEKLKLLITGLFSPTVISIFLFLGLVTTLVWIIVLMKTI